MTKNKSTKKALLTSVLCLLLCCSMLVGTTFAWFTDKVEVNNNIITAGNLDVELLAGGEKVDEETQLFDEVTLWEPGVVVYENLQVANVGTLALKYQLKLDILEENNLNGHKLSDVLKIAIIEEIDEENTTRAEVLADAKASENVGTLSNFYLPGELEPENEEKGTTGLSDVIGVVIFWEPGDNDNDYNANNGQITSDGKPLSIRFGLTLVATQMMYEEDSFGNDYDEFASILPSAKVIDLGAQVVNATPFQGNVVTEYPVPFVLQFQPNESLDEAKSSAYKYWHADYVVKADRDVPANSLALVGYYAAYCDGFNDGNWVALSSSETIKAGTEIRLVDVMGGGDGTGNGSIKVTYKDICQWGNDGTGFLCSATDLTGENAGTTLTVELRMYANESDPTNSSYNGGTETGEYYVIGTYTYTFPAVPVADDAAMDAALASGITSLKLAAGNYSVDIPAAVAGKEITIEGAGDSTVVDFTKVNGANGASITFKNMKFQGKNENVMNGFGIQNTTGHIVFENCTFDGAVTNEYFGSVEYKNCTFTGTGYITTYAVKSASFENCVFDKADSRAVLVYSHGDNPCVVTLENCEFKAAAKATTWAGDWTAAVEIDTTNIPTAGTSVTITNCTCDNNYSAIYRDKSAEGKANAEIIVN